MSSVPSPLRAALGLALTVVDTARDTATHLPQLATGLPIAVASQAVQLSLRAQQQYAAYVNKGDELIGTLRGAPEEAPSWATFDEDTAATTAAVPARNTAFDRVPDAEDELEELGATDELVDLVATITGEGATAGARTDGSAWTRTDPAADPLDAALDLLEGDYEAADGPAPTPGAPDTVPVDVPAADGDEVIGADAPRTTASREPAARKAARKTATKTSRKTAPRPASGRAPAAGRAAGPAPTAPAASGAPVAKKAARKAVKRVGRTETVPRTTLEGEPLPAATLAPDAGPTPVAADTAAGAVAPPPADALLDARPPLPASPDSAVSDTQPSPEAEL